MGLTRMIPDALVNIPGLRFSFPLYLAVGPAQSNGFTYRNRTDHGLAVHHLDGLAVHHLDGLAVHHLEGLAIHDLDLYICHYELPCKTRGIQIPAGKACAQEPRQIDPTQQALSRSHRSCVSGTYLP